MVATYRTHFAEEQMVEQYDNRYQLGTYDALLGEIERAALRAAIRAYLDDVRPTRWLDYATGTGRAVGYAADLVDEVVGMDSAAEMLGRARSAVAAPNVRWVVGDLLDPGTASDWPDSQFQLVTAFRLLLNLEPELRLRLLAALGRQLAPDGVLIVNTHGNPVSVKGLAIAGRRLRGYRVDRATLHGSHLSLGQVRRLAGAAGLEVVAVSGCGLVSAKVHRLVGDALTGRIERAAAGDRRLRGLGINQMVVLRRIAAA